MATTHLGHVPAGPRSAEQLAELVGEPITFHTPVVGTCVYLRPSHVAYRLSDGRVAMLTDGAAGRYVTVFGDYSEYRAAERDRFAGYDPETGRWS